MNGGWIVIGVLAAGTIALKAVGPATLGTRRPSLRVMGVIALVAPAILTGLVIYETFTTTPQGITLDARAVGLGVACLSAAARLPIVAIVGLAAAATALARAVS